MYLSFYGLQKKPFEVSTDPSFLWLGEKHKEALATLKYGNLANQGIILLTGDVGTGKTTLINALINSLGEEVIVAKVPDPGMDVIDFMNYISHAFGMKKRFVSKDAFLIDFDHFLNKTHAAGKKSLLIIDEAQRLSPTLLEEVRQLSNIERQETKLLSIFFVGQNEFNNVLREHKNRALRQRISLNYVIEPLDLHETGEFIRHRLRIAGTIKEIFSPDAVRTVYELSGGFPRRVNIICDHSLLLGFAENAKTVTSKIVQECARDLLLPESVNKEKNEPLRAVDTTESNNSEEVGLEPIQEKSSRNALKLIGIVLLAATAVFIVTFFMSPQIYRDLFSRSNTGEVRFSSDDSGANTLNPKSPPDPDLKTAAIERVSTPSELQPADDGGQELLPAEEPIGEAVKPDIVVSADDSPAILKKTTIEVDLRNTAEKRPGDEKAAIETTTFHSEQKGVPDPNNKNPANQAEIAKTPVILQPDVTVQPVVNTETSSTESAPPPLVNTQKQTSDQFSESVPPISENLLEQGPADAPSHDHPKGNEGSLTFDSHAQSSERADEKVNNTNMTDSLVSGVAGGTETKRVELDKNVVENQLLIKENPVPTPRGARLAEKDPAPEAVEPVNSSATDRVISNQSENQDPEALIDWVIKKRSQ